MTDLNIERWKLAHAEYRAEVALGWDRQKLFLTLSPTLTVGAVLAGLAERGTTHAHRLAAQLAFMVAALVALAGTLVVYRSHTRYRAARATLLKLEAELGISDQRTTGGQREAQDARKHFDAEDDGVSLGHIQYAVAVKQGRGDRRERFRIVDVLVVVFLLIAALDVALALTW